MLIFMSALLGPKELLCNLFVYTLILALRKTFADSFGFACRQLLYSNLSKFEAPRARRYFRSCFTFATIVLLLVSYNLICLGYWDLFLSFLTPLEISTATTFTCLLSLFTNTFRQIQKGALKALDLYRPDDVLLHQINATGFLGVNIIFSCLACYIIGAGLAGIWAA